MMKSTLKRTRIPSPDFVLLSLLVSAMFLVEGSAPAQENNALTLTRWDNTKLQGTLAGISEKGRKLKIQTRSGLKNIPLRSLLKISFEESSETRTPPIVAQTRGGSKISGTITKTDSEDHLQLSSPDLSGSVKLKLTRLDRISFVKSE